MKTILCTPGYWLLQLHKPTQTIGLYMACFTKPTKIVLTYNKGFISIFLVKNHIFNRLYHEYGFNPSDLSFNKFR
jgi:hypothetical protein